MSAPVFVAWLVLLRDLSVKGAFLLLAAWALTFAMRQAPAAARHLAWLLTFAGLLLLPLLSVTLPARPIAVLPAPAAPVVLPSPVAMPSVAEPPAAVEAPASIVPDQRPAPPLPARIRPARTLPIRALPPAPPDLPALLCCLWLLGVALAVLPLAAGWTLAARRLRRCSPITDRATLALAAEAGRRLGLRRPVSLRSGPSVSVPVTFGLVRPVILLPDGAASWPAERLRVALLHELAHIHRGDWATQTAARLVCALFWHNPLVWPAARMLRAEAERACDDLVLSSGIPALDYAQHLLAVAAALSGADRPLPLAVPMAGLGPLESRLRAVLTARPRLAPSRRVAVVAFVLALGVLIPLAVLRPAARAARRIAAPLTLVPVVLPAPPEAVRPSPVPLSAPAAPPAPFLTKPTPTGVPPMKPLTPVKAVALAALAATLALPVAKAQSPNLPASVPAASAPVASAPVASAPVASAPSTPLAVSVPPSVGAFPISLAVNQASMRDVLATMFKQEHLDYIIDQSVSGTVSLHLNGVPFDVALTTLLKASSQPLEYTVRGGVYHIQPRVAAAGAKEAVPATPRQVQIKFEWVSSASTPNAAPDKNVEVLTIIAEEGRTTQASSRHMRDGVGGEETISVLAHLKPGGVVTLDITEHSTMTAKSAGAVSSVNQTMVSFKDGETRSISSSILGSKQVGQSMERMLFVTPTIIQPPADGSAEPRPAPPQTGGATPQNPDIITLDARIAEVQRRLIVSVMKPMIRKRVSPAPGKTP